MPTPLEDFTGSKIILKVGDGASPEVFTARCTINSTRGIEWTNNVIEDTEIDCDAPDDPGWVTRETDTLSCQVTGEGRAHGPDIGYLITWMESGLPRNCQIVIDDGDVANQQTVSGSFLLTQCGFSGDRKAKATGTITLQSDGEVTHA